MSRFTKNFPQLKELFLLKYVNDSQNLAFATSHFVIELLPFDYLNNQKQ
jgi:hypothetical protein